VDGVDLTVRRGEALALVGESGSGKSTLARAIAGIQRANRGQIKLDGKVLPARRRSRGRSAPDSDGFQDPYSSLNPRLTVGGILHELLRVHHVVPRNEVESHTRQLLRMVGCPRTRYTALPRPVLRRPAPARRHRPGDRAAARAARGGRAGPPPST